MKWLRRITQSGIRGTILLAILCAAILPATVISVLAYVSSSGSLKDEANRSLLMQAKMLSLQVDSFMEGRLSAMASLVEDRQFLSAGASERTERLAQLLGEEIACAYELDAEGRVVAAAGIPEGARPNRDKYWSAVSTRQVYLGDCAISDLVGRPTIVTAFPIVSPTTGFAGAVVQEIDMAAVQAVLDAYESQQKAIGRTGYAYILNKEGLVIAHQDRAQIMVLRPIELGVPNLTAAVKDMQAGKEGTAVYVYQGIEALVAYSPMNAEKGQGWGMASKFPTSEVYEDVYRLRNLMIACVAVAAVVSAIASTLLANTIAKPIVHVSDVTSKVASGDLSVEVPDFGTKNEVGVLAGSMKTMISFLTDLARDVQGAAEETVSMSEELTAAASESSKGMEQVSASFQQVAAGAEDQSESASNMASQVEMLAAAIKEVFEAGQSQSNSASQLQASVNGIAGSLGEVVSAVEELTQNAQDNVTSAAGGQKAAVQTVETMDRISTDTDGLAAVIADLGNRSEEIGRIVDVITDIAGQTNLLALNAAIEAARAGEYGRGFAVVADEVRKLAEDSAKEAKLISQEVTNIRRAIESAVRSVNTVAEEVKRGGSIVADAGSALQEITKSTAKADLSLNAVKSVVGDLKEAVDLALNATTAIVSAVEANAERTSRMAESAGNVRELVDSVAAISEENAASVQVAASSSEEVTASTEGITKAAEVLAQVAASLRDTIARLRI